MTVFWKAGSDDFTGYSGWSAGLFEKQLDLLVEKA